MRPLAERWRRLPIADPMQHQIGSFFQTLLLLWIALATLGMVLQFVSALGQGASTPAAPPPEVLPMLATLGLAGLLLVIAPVLALGLLRRGHLDLSVSVAAWAVLISHSVATYLLGFNDPSVMVMFQIPIALAGLLGGRRLLAAVSGYSILFVILVGFLTTLDPPQAGFVTTELALDLTPAGVRAVAQPTAFFIVITVLTSLLMSHVRSALHDALDRSQRREAELEEIRASLESTVSARTAELAAALGDSRRQSAEQSKLLRQLSEQREALREMSVPVLPVSSSTLVMPLVGALDGERLAQVQDQALSHLQNSGARTLLLDITGVPVVDTHVAHGLMQVVGAGRLLGAQVVLVGIRPEVAQSIVGLGVQFTDVRTYSDLQSALSQLRR